MGPDLIGKSSFAFFDGLVANLDASCLGFLFVVATTLVDSLRFGLLVRLISTLSFKMLSPRNLASYSMSCIVRCINSPSLYKSSESFVALHSILYASKSCNRLIKDCMDKTRGKFDQSLKIEEFICRKFCQILLPFSQPAKSDNCCA
eukprot:NODE_535_length_6333_cov_1.473051.p4 type:complete len:147 gc:universal NODE_535_length_6333_cov_1.473051:3898-4338(+)